MQINFSLSVKEQIEIISLIEVNLELNIETWGILNFLNLSISKNKLASRMC